MTRDEILKLPAGEALNALIAVHVFGFAPDFLTSRAKSFSVSPAATAFSRASSQGTGWSENMFGAWHVVEAMRTKGYHWRLSTPPGPGQVFAGITANGKQAHSGAPDISVGAETMPLAICLVALVEILDPSGCHELHTVIYDHPFIPGPRDVERCFTCGERHEEKPMSETKWPQVFGHLLAAAFAPNEERPPNQRETRRDE